VKNFDFEFVQQFSKNYVRSPTSLSNSTASKGVNNFNSGIPLIGSKIRSKDFFNP